MPKKIDNVTKPKVAAKRIVNANGKTKPASKAVMAPAARPKRATNGASPATSAYTREDIALRAYFISEKRYAHELPGDEHQDWIEAERQLLAESKKAKKISEV